MMGISPIDVDLMPVAEVQSFVDQHNEDIKKEKNNNSGQQTFN